MTLPEYTAARYPETDTIFTAYHRERVAFTSGAELGMAFAEWASESNYTYWQRMGWYKTALHGTAGKKDEYITTASLFETYLETLKQTP